MQAPVHRLSKDKIVWLANHKCKHRHTYLEHYNCYLSECPEAEEKVGFLDIESSNLDANFGIMLSYCIKEKGSNKIYKDVINQNDIKKNPADKTDKRVVENCIRDMMRFDRVVAHYGRKFDMPFIRTRAIMCGVDFPCYGSLCMDDTWQWAKNKLKLNSNRLDTIVRALTGNSEKTHVDYKYWIGGVRGDKKSLNYILDHNIKDVIELEKIWTKLRDYVRINKSSI